MFRIILAAHLGFVATFGPAICCCSFGHVADRGGKGEQCCSKQHARNCHGNAAAETTVDRPHTTSLRRFCNRHQCNCDKVDKQISSLPKNGTTYGEFRPQLADVWVLPGGSPKPAVALRPSTAYRCNHMPAPLYGRAILRAHQILVI